MRTRRDEGPESPRDGSRPLATDGDLIGEVEVGSRSRVAPIAASVLLLAIVAVGAYVAHRPRTTDPAPLDPSWGAQIALSTARTAIHANTVVDGILAVSTGGCVYVWQTGGVRTDVVWPAEYVAIRRPDGTVEIRDRSRTVVAVQGTSVRYSAGAGSGGDIRCRVASDSAPVYLTKALVHP